MIQKFVDRFIAAEADVRDCFASNAPSSYEGIVEVVVDAIFDADDGSPHPKRIHTINDGDYQGTLLFVIGADGYQPSDYWFVKVGYGSCSGCDTLQAIQDGIWIAEGDTAIDDYWTLALHIVQGLTAMQDY
jgi:hypothetical protein